MPHDDFPAALDRLFAPFWDGRYEPNADVAIDDGDRIVVTVELAGADPESLQVYLDRRVLVVTGRRSDPSATRTSSILRKEIQFGEFFKRLRLPLPVDEERAEALYHDGLLRIALPVAAHDHAPVVRAEFRMTVKRTHA